MKKKTLFLVIALAIVVGLPALLHLSWRLTPVRPFDILVVNKTATPARDFFHQGLDWIFTHDKYLNSDGTRYQPHVNQMGFLPQKNKDYLIRDLEGATPDVIRQMAQKTDLVYYADNYGVYVHDWYADEIENPDTVPNTMIYGGLQQHDVDFIGQMLLEDKAVIAEYNFFSPPTTPQVREQAGQLLDLQWQGWQGKFFSSLRKNAGDLVPAWMVNLYEQASQESWSFTGAGIGLVNEDNRVVILEYPRHLVEGSFNIVTPAENRLLYDVPEKVPFPGWFEVTMPREGTSRVLAWYEIPVTPEGRELLAAHGIPQRFPAVIYRENPGRMWYFTGDFGKAEVPARFIRLQGARYLELLFTDLLDPAERKAFFFSWYQPLTSGILREISQPETNVVRAGRN